MLLEKKNAVIYGAGGAVGGAVARTFAREGARVFLAGRSRASIEAVAQGFLGDRFPVPSGTRYCDAPQGHQPVAAGYDAGEGARPSQASPRMCRHRSRSSIGSPSVSLSEHVCPASKCCSNRNMVCSILLYGDDRARHHISRKSKGQGGGRHRLCFLQSKLPGKPRLSGVSLVLASTRRNICEYIGQSTQAILWGS